MDAKCGRSQVKRRAPCFLLPRDNTYVPLRLQQEEEVAKWIDGRANQPFLNPGNPDTSPKLREREKKTQGKYRKHLEEQLRYQDNVLAREREEDIAYNKLTRAVDKKDSEEDRERLRLVRKQRDESHTLGAIKQSLRAEGAERIFFKRQHKACWHFTSPPPPSCPASSCAGSRALSAKQQGD